MPPVRATVNHDEILKIFEMNFACEDHVFLFAIAEKEKIEYGCMMFVVVIVLRLLE